MFLEQQATGWRESRGGGGGGEGAGGIWVGEKANFSVITLLSAWWAVWALRLPKGNLCHCVYADVCVA